MERRFQRHYTLAQARDLLPRLRLWLAELRDAKSRLDRRETRLGPQLAEGRDLGGERVNDWIRLLDRCRQLVGEFESREIQIKDLRRGLIDFPSLRGDREVFLCWEDGEEDIEFWHDLDSGYAGREPL
jgi:hypothetical protein